MTFNDHRNIFIFISLLAKYCIVAQYSDQYSSTGLTITFYTLDLNNNGIILFTLRILVSCNWCKISLQLSLTLNQLQMTFLSAGTSRFKSSESVAENIRNGTPLDLRSRHSWSNISILRSSEERKEPEYLKREISLPSTDFESPAEAKSDAVNMTSVLDFQPKHLSLHF